MSTTTATSSVFRFSTDDFPEKERLEAWQELFGRNVTGADVVPEAGKPLGITSTVQAMPGLYIMANEPTQHRTGLVRTKRHLADGDHSIILAMPGAESLARQFDSESLLAKGDAFVMTAAEACSVHKQVDPTADCMSLKLSYDSLLSLLRDKDEKRFGRIPQDNEALHFLKIYLKHLWKAPPTSPELMKITVSHVYDLLALAIGPTKDAAETARTGGLGAGRLQAAKDYARTNAHRHDLSLGEIAGRQRVSTRYLRLLFEHEGMTFSRFLRDHRLDRACQMLVNPRFAHLKISVIAYDCGFGELSNFNHAFRDRFATTPRDIREGAPFGVRPAV